MSTSSKRVLSGTFNEGNANIKNTDDKSTKRVLSGTISQDTSNDIQKATATKAIIDYEKTNRSKFYGHRQTVLNERANEINNIDVDALSNEIKDLEAKRDTAKPIYENYKVKLTGARGDQIEKVSNLRDSEIRNLTGDYTYDELNNLITEKKAQLVIADRNKRLKNLSSVINPESENYDKEFDKYKQIGQNIPWKEAGEVKGNIGNGLVTKTLYSDTAAAAWVMHSKNNPEAQRDLFVDLSNERIYEYLEPQEFDLLAYYLGKDKETGGKQAEEYLDLMEETLNQRMGKAIYDEKLKGNTALEILYGVPVGLDQFANGVKNLLDTESDYIPASAIQNAGQLARSDLSDVGFIGGLSLGQIGYDILSTTANMAPSILVSAAVGMINPTAGAWAGGALMGASSAGNAYQEALNSGMDKGQARVYSTLVGASEAAMSATVSKVFGGKVLSGKIENAISGIDKGLIRFAANYGWAFASEGLEEAAQEILTPLFENIALGYNKNGFDDIDWSEVAYSFLLGGLSGGAFDIIGSATNRITDISQIKKDYNTPQKVQNLLGLALSMPTDSKANTLAKKYNTEAAKQGKLSANKIYNLAIASENFINDRLVSLGDKTNTSAVANAIVRKLVGNELSVSEIELLSKSSYGQEVLNTTISSEQNNVIAKPETFAENQPLQIEEQAQETTTPEGQGEEITEQIGFREPTDQPNKTVANFGGTDTSNAKHLNKSQQNEITEIGEKLGRKVIYEDFYNLDKFKSKKKIPDGYIDKDGNVHINFYAKRPVYFLFKHEITHYLKKSLASYNDFMNLVIDSNAFKDWLNRNGYSSIDVLKTEIMDTYSEVEDFNEERCYDEILANFVGEYLFGGENTVSQKLINALEPKPKKTFMDVIRDIIDYFKSKFSKETKIQREINRIEKEFIKVYKEAVEVKIDETAEESYSFTGYAEDGKGKYKSNFPQGTPKKAKGERILKYIQEVWSKKPIRLKIKEDGITRYIEAKFDPTYDETKHIFNDATKLMGGNRHGTSSEQRVTLDLADDYYQIASEASYNYSKDETGKQNPAHEDVKKWHYFVNDIYFAEYDSEKYAPYRVTINVKEKSDGEYVYSFSAEKQRESDTPRTLHAVVNDGNNPDANVKLSNNKLTQPEPIVKNNISEVGENYSIPSTTSAESLLERYENGDITRQEYLDMLKGKKTLNPVEIANLKEEDANTTPPLQRKKGESDGDKESKFYGSIQKSELFGEEFKQEAASDKFIEKYKSVTNKETLQIAAKELEEGGQEYVEKWLTIKPERANLVDTAVGFILMDRYQRAGKIEQAIAVAEKVREFGTASGQQVQIFSIIGRFDPDMMVAYAKKELSQAFETMIKGKTNKWIDKNKEKFQLTEEDIEFIRRRTLQAAMFEDGTRQKAVALAEIQKTIQDKIPPESGDSIRALQRISMLLNPKTNERNIIGNAGMVGVFVASDVFGSGIDKIVSQKTGVRTTGNFDVKSVSGIKKGLYESYDDFKRGIRTKQEELNRFDTTVSRGNKNFNENGSGIFGTKVLKKQLNDVAKILNKIDNFTSFCLEAGDRPFFEMWYMNSLNTQLKLNNSEFPTTEMMEIAKEEALKRTWQDDNVYTRALSNLKKNVNIIHIPGTSYGLGDFIFKFVKTPTNLAKAIVEFSPLGFAGATSNAIKLKNAIETNQFNAQLQKEFVTSASNAITGTLVYALVAIGAALGIVKLSGDGDEDKDVSNYEKYIMGIPPYSIEFLGTNMTYDWMQPFGSVLATVADFMQTKKEQPDLKTSSVIWEAIKAGGKTFTKQSFLQSMYDFFSQDDIVDGISSLVLSEPSAFIPQAFSQLASYLDKYRRTTYDATNAFQTSINKIIAKIPGLRTRLPKQVNVLGEDVKNTQYLNVWEAFASPWNTYPKSSNEIVGEIYDLYKKTGEDSVMPRTVPNYLTVKGNKITFSPEEKAQFQRDIGQISAEMLAILFDNSEYKKLSDNEKTDVVSKIYEFAYAKSKSAIKYDYETLSAMAGEKKNGDPVLSKSDYKKLPEKARQIIAQEYFLSKAEVRYIDNYNMLIQSFIKKVKE